MSSGQDFFRQNDPTGDPLADGGTPDPSTDPREMDEFGGQDEAPSAGAELEDSRPAGILGEPTMAELEAQISISGLKERSIVEGTVVRIDEEGVLVDVGTKSEGLINPKEFSEEELESLRVGDKIQVFAVSSDDEDGGIILSKKRADHELNWERILAAYESGEIVQCTVVDRVRGGLRVDLGVTGFIPASHVGVRNPNELDRFVGEVVNAKIIEVERNRKKVILSRRQAEREVREKGRGRILAELKEGQVREGIVRNITNYGAFVDLGGVDGLLHITELDWVHVKHPSEVLTPGDELRVMILKVDREKDRISLSRKQLLPDPWELVSRNYRVGATIEGPVTRCVTSGAFVKLPEGVEAFIPIGEMSDRRISKPEEVVKPGDTVTVKVINVQPRQRRMSLSLSQVQQDAERAEMDKYLSTSSEPSSGATLGAMFGDQLRAAVGESSGEASTEAPEAPEASETPETGEEPTS
ncbi:MAG: 30S ribosomal protein S1 [Armatimonadetes bacterium]|nr:30S ribosomal protein S1 [Armatimonadota bacterium]MDI9601062.1 30S ribosomal protein S1 [Acidobacteriota bacterium]